MAEHGTVTRYNRGRCRCDECRTASTRAAAERRARRRAGIPPPTPAPRPEPEHGTINRYAGQKYLCRCPQCRAAMAAYRAARADRKGAATSQAGTAVRARAVRRLIAAHPDEFAALLSEESGIGQAAS